MDNDVGSTSETTATMDPPKTPKRLVRNADETLSKSTNKTPSHPLLRRSARTTSAKKSLAVAAATQPMYGDVERTLLGTRKKLEDNQWTIDETDVPDNIAAPGTSGKKRNKLMATRNTVDVDGSSAAKSDGKLSATHGKKSNSIETSGKYEQNTGETDVKLSQKKLTTPRKTRKTVSSTNQTDATVVPTSSKRQAKSCFVVEDLATDLVVSSNVIAENDITPDANETGGLEAAKPSNKSSARISVATQPNFEAHSDDMSQLLKDQAGAKPSGSTKKRRRSLAAKTLTIESPAKTVRKGKSEAGLALPSLHKELDSETPSNLTDDIVAIVDSVNIKNDNGSADIIPAINKTKRDGKSIDSYMDTTIELLPTTDTASCEVDVPVSIKDEDNPVDVVMETNDVTSSDDINKTDDQTVNDIDEIITMNPDSSTAPAAVRLRSIVDLTNSPLVETDATFISESASLNKSKLSETNSLNDSSLIMMPDTPKTSVKPISTLDDTFSPEPSSQHISEPANTTYSAEKLTPPKCLPNALSTPATRFSCRTPTAQLKNPITSSVKRLKYSPGHSLKRVPTPYKPGSSKSIGAVVNDPTFKRVNAAATPAKNLLEAALSLTTNLKSIRKRSFSVDGDLPKKQRQRVTFHSPSNKEMPIDEIDQIMECSRREVKGNQENTINRCGYQRKRSFSNAETMLDRVRPLREMNAEHARAATSKAKIPDFAAIHKRNFDRMESIEEYAHRKDERSKEMLSNQKSLTKVKGVTITSDTAGTAPPVVKKNLFDESNAAVTVAPKTALTWSSSKSKAAAVLSRCKIVKPMKVDAHKLQNRLAKNKELYKAGSSKPKTTEVTAVEKQKMLRGVRTNRRFDLQMKFRNNIEHD